MPKGKTITDSLTGVLSDSNLDEIDHKKHLEEKHLQCEIDLKKQLEVKIQAGIDSGISKRSMDEIFDAAMLRVERGKGETERGLELLSKAMMNDK